MAEETLPMAKNKTSPDVCSYVDESHSKLNLEISLAEVRKEDIQLKMHADSFNLTGSREDFDYVTTMALCCPVKPEKAKTTYENGLVKIQVPFKDLMEDAVSVSMN
jgi:HSP20 family molecular chaperone IbpA